MSCPFADQPRFRLLMFLASAAFVLAGCSAGNESSEPTTSTTPTAEIVPKLAPGQIAVESLVADIAAAWPSVQNVRITYYSGVTNGNIDMATNVSIEEVILPSDRRIVTLANGADVNEQVFVGGRVYMRGSFVSTNVAPNVPPGTWVTVDPSVVPEFTPVGEQLQYLTASPTPPFQTVSDTMKSRGATDAGVVDVLGRQCRSYTFSENASGGGEINYELAIDGSGLPCRLVQGANGYSNVTHFEFNVPGLQIIAPDAATPASGTPEG